MALLALARWQRPAAPDPFRVLETQARLSRLQAEIEALDRTDWGHRYALAFHLQAVLLAYEHTLQEACWLARLPVTVDGPTGRLLAEAHLQAAGWSW
jgi:hypothetical protein